MVHYKLTYFDLKGRGECIRLLFAHAGVPFEDCRISPAEWPALKEKLFFPVLPVLEIDGKPLQQSLAICRCLAKQFDLCPADPYETAQCDMLADGYQDTLLNTRKFVFEPDPEKKKEIWKELEETQYLPFCYRCEKMLANSGSGFLVGNSLTWVDLLVYTRIDIWTEVNPDMLKDCPKLQKLQSDVEAIPQIKEWIAKRPPSD